MGKGKQPSTAQVYKQFQQLLTLECEDPQVLADITLYEKRRNVFFQMRNLANSSYSNPSFGSLAIALDAVCKAKELFEDLAGEAEFESTANETEDSLERLHIRILLKQEDYNNAKVLAWNHIKTLMQRHLAECAAFLPPYSAHGVYFVNHEPIYIASGPMAKLLECVPRLEACAAETIFQSLQLYVRALAGLDEFYAQYSVLWVSYKILYYHSSLTSLDSARVMRRFVKAITQTPQKSSGSKVKFTNSHGDEFTMDFLNQKVYKYLSSGYPLCLDPICTADKNARVDVIYPDDQREQTHLTMPDALTWVRDTIAQITAAGLPPCEANLLFRLRASTFHVQLLLCNTAEESCFMGYNLLTLVEECHDQEGVTPSAIQYATNLAVSAYDKAYDMVIAQFGLLKTDKSRYSTAEQISYAYEEMTSILQEVGQQCVVAAKMNMVAHGFDDEYPTVEENGGTWQFSLIYNLADMYNKLGDFDTSVAMLSNLHAVESEILGADDESTRKTFELLETSIKKRNQWYA